MNPLGKIDAMRFDGALGRARAFLRGEASEQGIAATEFALILPVALVLFTGVLTYGTANDINRKVTVTARTVTDLVAQCSALLPADMTTLLSATSQVMAPFPAANTTVIVSQVQIPPSGTPTISWSTALSGSGYTAGSNVTTLPTGIVSGNTTTTYLIWGHVSYAYTPAIGYVVTGPITLSEDFYINPRVSPNGQITYPSTTTTNCD
jgi:Flp pilus assembly protein TadG